MIIGISASIEFEALILYSGKIKVNAGPIQKDQPGKLSKRFIPVLLTTLFMIY